MYNCLTVFAFALLLDFLIGDPAYSLHPTRIIGKIIKLFESILEKAGIFNLFGGILLVLFVLLTVLFFYLAGVFLSVTINAYIYLLVNIFIVYSSIALKDMEQHAESVYEALCEKNIDKARKRVSMIVGRDVNRLDETGIIKAVIESVSENFIDGFFAVLFWYFIGCFAGYMLHKEPLIFAAAFSLSYRAVNTMDSMVGYKNKRYAYFGRFAAKLDDFANFIPARLSIIFICLSAAILKKDSAGCLKTAKKDRLKHPSPNSACAESAVAGVLNIKLGGKIIYPHTTIDEVYLGEQFSNPQIEDIRKTTNLIMVSAALSSIVFMTLIFLLNQECLWR